MCASFDDTLLTSVFQPRYMSFELCVCLEPVSKRLQQMARVFYRQLDHLDVEHFSARLPEVNWAQKIHACCPNLKFVDKMAIEKENLNRDKFSAYFLSKMKRVTRIGLQIGHLSPLAMLMLGDMRNLTEMEISSTIDPDSCDLNLIGKLRVTSLKCENLFWLQFFDPDHLKVLEFTKDSTADYDELIEMLRKYENLREIKVVVEDYSYGNELLEFADFVSNVLKAELSVRLRHDTSILERMVRSNIRKHVTDLLCEMGEENVQTYLPAISQLSSLKHLSFDNLQCPLDASRWLPSLSSLSILEVNSRRYVELTNFFLAVNFTTSSKKRCVLVFCVPNM